MGHGTILPYGAINPFARGDGVETRLMVGQAKVSETPFTSGTTIFPAGASAPMHSHNCAEQVTVLAGLAVAEVDGVRTELGPMDTSFIPAEVPHRFANAGDGPLTILWIYGATDVTRTFTDTGETVPHLSLADKV
ncbi:MAG: cupin domain-containing protein [Pseudomonadota bacterium]